MPRGETGSQMAVRAKAGAWRQALLIAASITALSASAAHAQQAGDLNDLGNRVLENPQDADLSLRYAAAAEAAGKPRLALTAYERILINDPSNEVARRGYERVRRMIEPSFTVTRVEAGVRWDSNPANFTDTFFFDPPEGTTYYGKVMVANESEFVGRRWRSIFNLDLETTPEIHDLDYDYVGVQTGPIFYAGPHMAVLPAIGGGAAWLGGDHYFNEVNLSLTLEGRAAGASYWARLRGGYRDYDHNTNDFFTTPTEHGPYAELQAGLTKPHTLFERDTLLVSPFVRWSDVEGDVFDYVIFDELSPGKYLEYGADVNYNYQVTDHIQASVGALVRKRDFSGNDREDTYVSPQVSVTLQRALPCDCDVRLQYRYRDNDSNDFIDDYHADQVSLQLTTRF